LLFGFSEFLLKKPHARVVVAPDPVK